MQNIQLIAIVVPALCGLYLIYPVHLCVCVCV